MTLNWKQCVWNREDHKDIGLIQVIPTRFVIQLSMCDLFLLSFQQNCNFRKHDSNSALHVAYAGNLRVLCSSGGCCSR